MFFRRYDEKKVTLRTISRNELSDGKFEYQMVVEPKVSIENLPANARHCTGEDGVYARLFMDPRLPSYAEEVAETDDGQPAHNYVDAIGYYFYFVDTRMKEAFDSLAELRPMFKLDKAMIVAIVASVAVVGFVVWKFLM